MKEAQIITQEEDYKEVEQLTHSNEKPKKTVWAWSCCRNGDQNSKGCHRVIVDKYKWIFDAPG